MQEYAPGCATPPCASLRASRMAAMQGISGPCCASAVRCHSIRARLPSGRLPVTFTSMPPSSPPKASIHEAIRPALDRQCHAPPAQQGGEPQSELLRGAFERGAELHRQYAGIALRKELEVRNVAGGGPARAQPVEAHALELLPAPRVAPRAAAAPLEPPPGVAEHRRDRRFSPRRALSRRDRDLDLLDLRKARAQAVDHGRRKGGHAARARD